MIFRFPCARTDKVGLARSMRAARIFMQAFYPAETIIDIKFDPRSMMMDVYTLSNGDDFGVLIVAPNEVLEGNY